MYECAGAEIGSKEEDFFDFFLDALWTLRLTSLYFGHTLYERF